MSTPTLSVPPLRQGDRLSREEFERRYDAMPDVKKAELLNGVVYMASPVTVEHGNLHGDLMGWLYTYRLGTPGVDTGDNSSLRLPLGGMPQPDVFLRIKESHGGRSWVDADGYFGDAPDLLGEVAKSSRNYDSNVKMPIYRDAGVAEFILWRVDDRAIDWYFLNDGEYQELPTGPDGIIRSKAFPGLWLNVEAMIRRDDEAVIGALRQGLASAEHAQFVAALQKAATSKPQ